MRVPTIVIAAALTLTACGADVREAQPTVPAPATTEQPATTLAGTTDTTEPGTNPSDATEPVAPPEEQPED